MSIWVDGVLLPVVDSAFLTGFVIVNSLLGHESICKELTKFGGVFIRRNKSPSEVFLFTKMFSLTSSFNINSIETLSMLEASLLDRYSGVDVRNFFFSFIRSMAHKIFGLNQEDISVFSPFFSKSLAIDNFSKAVLISFSVAPET